MNKALILCVVTFLVLMGILLYVQFGLAGPSAAATQSYQAMMRSADAPNATTETTATETEIRAVLKEYYTIARTNDREALKVFSRSISAPEYSYSSELGVMNKDETVRMVDSVGRTFLTTGYEDLHIIEPSADTAVVKYLDVSLVRSMGGMKRLKQTRFTSFWVKRDGKWLIVAEHSSVLTPAKLRPRHPLADNVAHKTNPLNIAGE